ncbi:hypothetical protein [uncultured Phycicoccus sp.]|uniref:hypothetical protein n=1 Tax=uncultured Phycicoccus sp. TaxID=661422 RepID=UPI0026121765|nr:hypothetical protein [uncultured Phycicoccus sp.]
MTTDGGRPVPRRPIRFGPADLEAHGGTRPGPAETTEVAHQTAAILVGTGRAAHDPEVTSRLVGLVDDLGLPTIADLWSSRPARSLPGALWRLYALREWVRRNPEGASREYAAGMRFTDVAHVVAGIAEPPRPEELQRVADQILAGIFDGDLAVALERASAFCAVIAAGRAELAHDSDGVDPDAATGLTRSGAALLATGEDLRACANLWRSRDLD